MARILVVEDEPHLAMGLRFNLEADGHAVDVAGDGESALTRLEAAEGTLDAVVLDVMLPGIDGFDVTRALRARGDFVPILMLTARGRSDDVLLGFEAGVDVYADAVINHMAGVESGTGWAGTAFSHYEYPAAGAGSEGGAGDDDPVRGEQPAHSRPHDMCSWYRSPR